MVKKGSFLGKNSSKLSKIGQKLVKNWSKLVKIGQNWSKLVKIGQNWSKSVKRVKTGQNWSKKSKLKDWIENGQNGQNWKKFKMAEIVKIFGNFFSIVPWQGYFYDLFFFFPFPLCPRFFSLLRACCNFLASLSAFFSALIASRRFSRNIDESQVGLLRYGLSSAKVRTRRRWLMFLHSRLSSRRNFWNWKIKLNVR